MLTVEAFGLGGSGATVIEATRILVRDANENPVALIVELDHDANGRSSVLVTHWDDDNFTQLLETFGIDKVVVLKRITIPPR